MFLGHILLPMLQLTLLIIGSHDQQSTRIDGVKASVDCQFLQTSDCIDTVLLDNDDASPVH
jgi:hypothetical protein